MKVFLSWSGTASKEIAEELYSWIPTVLQSVKPYFSPADIEKGAKWDNEITTNLNESSIGIICVTPDNTNKPWILFEAGALSNKLDKSRVCPLLFDLNNSDVTGPLATFQTTAFNKLEFKKLVQMINKQLGEFKISDTVLDTTFNAFFSELEQKISDIIAKNKSEKSEKTIERSERDILEEILELTRRQYSMKPHFTGKNYDVKKKYEEIGDSERRFIESQIFNYMKDKSFRLKEYREIDEEDVTQYLKDDMEVRKATGNIYNLRQLIVDFKNQ